MAKEHTGEVTNDDKLIATKKTPHTCMSQSGKDLLIHPSSKEIVRGTTWHETKRLRTRGDPHAAPQNTFIDGAHIFVTRSRLDGLATSDQPHAIPFKGKASAYFRGDTEGELGSSNLLAETNPVMRTLDRTKHNCMPRDGAENCRGVVKLNDDLMALNGLLAEGLKKKCKITSFKATCEHGRAMEEGGRLEVIAGDVVKLEVVRRDLSKRPPSKAECQASTPHAKWIAMDGEEVLVEGEGDTFEVTTPGGFWEEVEGILGAISWMLRALRGPKILMVSAEACAGEKTGAIAVYPSGKFSFDLGPDLEKIREKLAVVKQLADMLNAVTSKFDGGAPKNDFQFLAAREPKLDLEVEYKERAGLPLVGLAWKISFGLQGLLKANFGIPIPLTKFLKALPGGGFVEFVLDLLEIRGILYFGFESELSVVGTLSRDENGKFSPGFEVELSLVFKGQLRLVGGIYALVLEIFIEGTLTFAVAGKPEPPKVLGISLKGSIQLGAKGDVLEDGKVTRTLAAYKPRWGKWPKNAAREWEIFDL